MNPLPESVWERCRFSEVQAVEVPNFRNWLRESETDLGIYLADAELPPSALKPEFEVIDVREIESLIARSCDPKTDYLFYGRLLKLVISELTRSGVLIPSPKLLESLRREKHPCPDDFVPYHLQVEEWSKAACGWTRRFAEGKGSIPVGLVALCSILWGRALQLETVLAIVGACSSTERRFRYSSVKMIYTDLSLPWNNLQHQEIQRWYADGPLACLIARVGEQDREAPPADPKDTKAYSAWKARVTKTLFDEIQHGLLDNGVKKPPRDLAAIIKAVDLTLVSYVPPLFREFWTREIHPRSLWPGSIVRIYGEESLASDIIKQIEQTAPDEIELDEYILEEAEKEESQNAENPTEPPEWVTELLGCLTGSPHQAVQLLRACIGRFREAAPIAGELAEFALRLLEKGAFTTGTRWQFRTVRSCVRSVAVRLGQLVGDTDLATLEAVSLASFYQQAIDLVTEGKDPNRLKESVMMALREFHRFMVNRYPNLSLNESEIFRSYRGLFSVDARILSMDDVLQILQFLDRSTLAKNEVERKAAKFLVVLAFSIGSRRMENFWLREIDFPSCKTLSVIFRPWGNHRLKTLNATRVGHFKAFHMPPPFEQVVVDWYEMFDRQAGKKEQYKKEKEDKFFLRGTKTAEQSIPVHVLIPIVHEAMQEVTGDSTVHLHLLRHSCASWTFVRLILSDFEKIPDLFAHIPETNRWIKESSKPFRLALYENENVTNDHGWAISTLLGQSRPDVPMDNYIHTVDRLSPVVLSESGYLDNVYEDTLLRDASGLEFGTFYNRLKKHKSPAEIVEEVVTSRIPKATLQPARTLKQNWAFSTHELMRLVLTSGQPVYDLAPALNMEREVAERVLRRMDELLGTDNKSLERVPERPHRSHDGIITDLAGMIEGGIEREDEGKTQQRLADLVGVFEMVKKPIPEFALFTPATTSMSAIKYMDCLAIVGILRADLRFLLWGVKTGSDEDKALQKIGGRHPYEYLPGQPRGVLRGPCLTIGPRFDPRSPKAALKSESALRFVLEMASFRFGAPSKRSDGATMRKAAQGLRKQFAQCCPELI